MCQFGLALVSTYAYGEPRLMAQSSTTLHESPEALGPEIVDRHRAIVSLMEELEAVDWYDQRAATCSDPELREILIHNRDEEKEHACMVLEWLRRNDTKFDEHMRKFLFKEGSIAHREEAEKAGGGSGSGSTSLGIGSLRKDIK
jgi:ferritin-like protein